jgi:hypothetical protein
MRIFYSYMSDETTLEKAIIDYWDTFMEGPKSVICSPEFHFKHLVGRHPDLKIFVQVTLLLKNQFLLSSVESIHEASDYLIGSPKGDTLKMRGDGVPLAGDPDQEGRDPSFRVITILKSIIYTSSNRA